MNNHDLLHDQSLIEHDSDYFTIDEFIAKIKITLNQFNHELNKGSNNDIDNFSLIHFNARSLNKSYDDLNTLFSVIPGFNFSVIGVTETWLNANSPPVFNLDNYTMVRADRKEGRGGGVAIYLRNQLNIQIRHDIHIEGAEDIFVEVINDFGKNILIGVVYRPPNNQIETFLDNLDESLHTIIGENKDVYLMGDYNINILPPLQNNSLKLNNILLSYSLHPHINKPTRISKTSSTLIDNIFSNNVNKECLNGILYYDISDHLPIFSIIKQTINVHRLLNNTLKMHRKENSSNIDSLNIDLCQEQWLDVFEENDVDKAYEKFNHKLQKYYDKNIPLVRTKYKKVKNPWITKGILKSIKTRNKLYKKSLKKMSDENCSKYKIYRNKLTSIIRISRKLHYSNKIDMNKTSNASIWQIVKDMIGSKNNTPKSFFKDGQEINNPVKIANMFNSYFNDLTKLLKLYSL